MRCKQCNLSRLNSVHNNTYQYGYHQYVEPDPEPVVPTLEERITALEAAVEEIRSFLVI